MVHAVVVALLYRKAAGLHWLSLMDHIRQSKAAHSRGKQGGGCGWIRGLLCLKVQALCVSGTRQRDRHIEYRLLESGPSVMV